MTGSVSRRNIDLVAILAALSVFLSLVEYSIPKPVPFLKIGFANLPLLLGLRLLSPGYFFLLVFAKIFAQGIINGTLISYVIVFSCCGSLAAAFVMRGLQWLLPKYVSLVGLSLMGALASNLVQLFLARYLVFGAAAWLLGPPFILTGIISSVMLGFFAQHFYNRSRWIRLIQTDITVSTTAAAAGRS